MVKNVLTLTAAALAIAATVGCEKAQLLAPTQSTITVTAASRLLPANGETDITAAVVEQAGTPVQNGTTVRFTTNLGRVDPVEVQTRNGLAMTRFFANNSSGIARITATSGAASGGTNNANVVEITVGTAAINTVSVRANPGSIGPTGGSVELIATVVGENGQPVSGVTVTFNADQGSLSASTAATNASGEARTTLTTNQQTVVSATAGTKTSTNVTITQRAGPIVSIACAPSSGTGNCSAVQASSSNNTATVVFTITRPTGSSPLRTATIDFGDGSSQALGNIAGGTATVTHTYTGPSSTSPRVYTATVQATDINNESQSASTTVIITPRATITPINVSLTATSDGNANAAGQRWTFTATATGGGEGGTGNAAIESYRWDFGDGQSATTSGNTTAHVYEAETTPQRRTVTVTVRTADGRTAEGRTEIIVDDFIPTP
jgi:hypothetical protein